MVFDCFLKLDFQTADTIPLHPFFWSHIPSGGLTFIVGAQKWGFSCKVQRRTPADIFLNESLPPKTPWWHHVHGRHGHGSLVKNRWRFSKFKKKGILTLILKICILQENGFKELTLVLFESMLQGLHILFNNIFGQTIYWSTAKPWTNPKKTFKCPWKIQVSSTSSKFCLCASLKTCDLQILGNA
jgi:hypothetical protein